MLAALLGMLVRRNFANVERGEIGKALAIFSDDCRFTFPGSHSFAAVDFNKSQLREWLVRLAALHPRFEVRDVYVNGPPWNQRIAFHLTDEVRAPDGFVYRNEIVECARARWGKIRSLRVFLDTQAVAELDRHVAASPVPASDVVLRPRRNRRPSSASS
jgi:ketosteroid isomerase-like protein